MPEKPGQLIITQIDHLTGEQLGSLVEALFKEGIKNAHLVPSLTKKGRPGYLLFIDLGEVAPERISDLLVKDHGIQGFHLINTNHHFFQ